MPDFLDELREQGQRVYSPNNPPPGGGAIPIGTYAPGSFTLTSGQFAVMGGRLELTGSQTATLEGDSVLVVVG